MDTDFGNFESSTDSYSVGPVWGFQRNYASGIHLDLSLGIGYYGDVDSGPYFVDSGVTFVGGFEFGFRFN